MSWYIGQDVVCIKTHSKGIVKEGEIFNIIGLQKICCGINLDVGIKTDFDAINCGCGKYQIANGVYWLGEVLFSPLDSLTDISEIDEVLSKPVFEIN